MTQNTICIRFWKYMYFLFLFVYLFVDLLLILTQMLWKFPRNDYRFGISQLHVNIFSLRAVSKLLKWRIDAPVEHNLYPVVHNL
jgi:hypothetical protein